jgi:hypothetical protein
MYPKEVVRNGVTERCSFNCVGYVASNSCTIVIDTFEMWKGNAVDDLRYCPITCLKGQTKTSVRVPGLWDDIRDRDLWNLISAFGLTTSLMPRFCLQCVRYNLHTASSLSAGILPFVISLHEIHKVWRLCCSFRCRIVKKASGNFGHRLK